MVNKTDKEPSLESTWVREPKASHDQIDKISGRNKFWEEVTGREDWGCSRALIIVERTGVKYGNIKEINTDLATQRPLAILTRAFSVMFKSWMREPRCKEVNAQMNGWESQEFQLNHFSPVLSHVVNWAE